MPQHLSALAGAEREVELDVAGRVTQKAVVDALELRFPALAGALRDPHTMQRRPFVRFFACGEDISHQSQDLELPDAIISGKEQFLIVAAISGG